jgi:uncharacterized protein
MGLEIRPLGVKCNIQCRYCYQNPQRDAGNVTHGYDLESIKSAIERHNESFTLFGGEALLVPMADLEELLALGYEKFGRSGIQTNGTLLSDRHVQIFRKYNVHVGISLDGPDELNDVRWAGSLNKTRAATARSEAAIRRLCREGLAPSLIITLHKGNAEREKLADLAQWIREMESLGVTSVRLHALEVDDPEVEREFALTWEENLEAFIYFAELEREFETLKFDIFRDLRRMLTGRDNEATCIWTGCDPYATQAVQGVEGNGQASNCGRTNKDGVDFVKADSYGFERYIALYHTPQSVGGCKGCRFFLQCKGNCPGTALDSDWRNRTRDCALWYRLLSLLEERLESEGKLPLSKHPAREDLEARFIGAWADGGTTYLYHELDRLNATHDDHQGDTSEI